VAGLLSVKNLFPDLRDGFRGDHLHVVFQGGSHLLDEEDPAGRGEMPIDQFSGKRPGRRQLEDSHPFLQPQDLHSLPAVERADAAADDEQLRRRRARVGVERAGFEDLRRPPHFFLLRAVLELRGGEDHADHRTCSRVEQRAAVGEFCPGLGTVGQGAEADIAAGVGQARHAADHDDIADLLGEVESPRHDVLGLLEIPRLQKRDLQKAGKQAGFPLVDAGQCAGVVAGDEEHAPPRPGAGQVQQEVGGHVDAVLLHDAHGAQPGEGGRRGHFRGHFLVGRPLDIEVAFLRHPGEALDDLRRRGAGISGGHVDAGLQGAPDNRLVSHEEVLGIVALIDQV